MSMGGSPNPVTLELVKVEGAAETATMININISRASSRLTASPTY